MKMSLGLTYTIYKLKLQWLFLFDKLHLGALA